MASGKRPQVVLHSTRVVKQPLNNGNNSCFACNQANPVEYFDTGRYFDAPYPLPQEGRIYICFDCIKDAAREFGYSTPKETQELVDRNAYLEDVNAHNDRHLDLVKTIEDAATVIAAGYAGIAENKPAPVEQSVPDVAKVEDAVIVDTKVSEDEEVVDDATGTPRKRKKS